LYNLSFRLVEAHCVFAWIKVDEGITDVDHLIVHVYLDYRAVDARANRAEILAWLPLAQCRLGCAPVYWRQFVGSTNTNCAAHAIIVEHDLGSCRLVACSECGLPHACANEEDKTAGASSTVALRGAEAAAKSEVYMKLNPDPLHSAPGGPGIEPRWTHGAKTAIGTAYSTSSRIWYTLDAGCVTEVYYPTIDMPQIRDLQFLFTDGETFFHDERRNFCSKIDCLSEAALGFELINREKNNRYTVRKTILGDPYQNCLLLHARVEAPQELLAKLRMYILCAPHLEIGGWHNNGHVVEIPGRKLLAAHKGNTWLMIAATVPFTEAACGYVGVNDGWTDLADNYRLDWQYESALDGNIALTGGLDLSRGTEFTVALAFGTSQHDAMSTLAQSLSIPFEQTREAFIHQWGQTSKRFSLAASSHKPALFERSVNLLLAHEDKNYPGALIASLSVPWGDEKSDWDLGGYHLVWTRDLVKCATGLLAVGDVSTPLRSLIYLAVSQRDDGGFYQNFWIDGRPYWQGIQLDEVAFPVLLAWKLWKHGALGNFDPYQMIRRACGFLVREGPVTAQDRWEEASGYSPSTLAVHIAALICAAEFFEDRGDHGTADFARNYADFLESHIEQWTVTTQGTLLPGVSRHYIRINPVASVDCADEDPNCGVLTLQNQAPGARYQFPAKEIVDAGFLELVRYGIRSAEDPIIEDSVKVIDAVLKVETPYGPCWRRYNRDGYGQRDDGTSYDGWGTGRAWPLLTGERGHYEIAAGRDPGPYLRALENFAQGIGLIPEQVWDSPDIPARHLSLGGRPERQSPCCGRILNTSNYIGPSPIARFSMWFSPYMTAMSPATGIEGRSRSGNSIASLIEFIPALFYAFRQKCHSCCIGRMTSGSIRLTRLPKRAVLTSTSPMFLLESNLPRQFGLLFFG
jgi:glucoamylase